MKILLINNQARPETSGLARHFESIGESLLILGHEIERLVAKNSSFKKKNKKIKYYYFNYVESTNKMSDSKRSERVKKNRSFIRTALKKIHWKTINLVILGNDIYVPELKKYISQKRIVPIIPSPLAFSKKTNPQRYQRTISRMKKNLQGVRVVVLSQKMKSLIRSFLPNTRKYNIHVIPPGVDLQRFARKNETASNDLLCVGRMTKEKNIEALLCALRLVKSPLQLKLVGKGPHLKSLKKFAKGTLPDKKILFLGKKKRVAKYYRESKIFVFPTKYEAFGLVILEAMAAGLPVIAFRSGKEYATASNEIISNGSDGFLVRNVAEMAQKIDLLLKNPSLRVRMSKKALKKAAQFSWINHSERLLKLIKK